MKSHPLKVGAIVQCTASDLYASRNPDDYCIAIAQQSKLFDEILLAVPDTPDSQVFQTITNTWGVGLVMGSEFNVAERLYQAARDHQIDIIVRLLLRRFYLDIALVSEMLELLSHENADYIRLPLDFNYELGADVFT